MAGLDRERIFAEIGAPVRELLGTLEVFDEIDSTNRYLLERASEAPPGRGLVCLADFQSAGRGQRGRRWVAAPGSAVMLSVLWRFEPTVRLSGLSLAVGVAVAEALQRLGLDEVALKWPNDVLVRGRKICGILLETRNRPDGRPCVVAGVGLNAGRPGAREEIEQPFTDVASELGRIVEREPVAAALVTALLASVRVYQDHGFAEFLARWRALDAAAGQSVSVVSGERTAHGIGRGVDEDGALVVEIDGALTRFHSGDVSLRMPPRREPTTRP